jgi:hypothetical protein
MDLKMIIELPSDVERVANAFGAKLGLEGPATVEDIEKDVALYIQNTTRGWEQTRAVQVANELPPVGISTEPKPEGKKK